MQDERAERRNQILNAAEVVFARQGIDEARMDDIVEEVGLSKGTLYWYFDSKDDLILALLDRIYTREMQHAQDLLEADIPAKEKMEAIITSALQEIGRFATLIPLAFEFIALAGRRPSVRKTLKSYYHNYQEIAETVLRQGVESGEFHIPDVDHTALAMVGLVEGLALMWFVDPEWFDLTEVQDIPMQILHCGIEGGGRNGEEGEAC